MKEPLMSKKELAVYVLVAMAAVAAVWITMEIPMNGILWRLISLIPAGFIAAVWTAMTLGIFAALRGRKAAK